MSIEFKDVGFVHMVGLALALALFVRLIQTRQFPNLFLNRVDWAKKKVRRMLVD